MSKKILVEESFIQAAYDAACTGWKEKILENIPEFKVDKEFAKIGDKFILCNEHYILCRTSVRPNKVNLINLRNGNIWDENSIEIRNSPYVSKKEFDNLCRKYNFQAIKS